jgi:hypothetical protein
VDNVTDQPVSPAVKRFRELVRQRRSLLKTRKERSDWPEIYAVATLRQVLEQVSAEMNAGIAHDPTEVKALLDLAGERVEAAAKKPAKVRFRGVGR